MPPPPLSIDDDPEVGVTRTASATNALLSCTNAMSPTSATVGAPGSARPSAVEITPSMPLAPRLAWARAAVRRTTRGRAPASTTRRRVRRRRGSDRRDRAGDTRLRQRGLRAARPVSAASARSLACRQRASQGVSAAPVSGASSSSVHRSARCDPGRSRPDRRPATPGRPIAPATATAPSRPAAARSRTTISGACASANAWCAAAASRMPSPPVRARGSPTAGRPAPATRAAPRRRRCPRRRRRADRRR